MPGSNSDLNGPLIMPILRTIGEVGTTDPVATEQSYNQAAPFPNSDPYGAQPAEHTPAHAAGEPAAAPQGYTFERDESAPYADPDWRGSVRINHVPATTRGWLSKRENAFGEHELIQDMPVTPPAGVIQPETIADAPKDKPLWRQVKWYKPSEAAGYVRVNGEALTRRMRIAGALGAMAATGIFTAYSVWNSYKHGAPLPFIGGEHAAAVPPHPAMTPEPHPTPDAATTTPTPDVSVTPTQPSPDTTTMPPITEPAVHLRTAVSLDHETGRASNVYDWSADALRDAAKEAGLTTDQANSLAHNHANLHRVNEAFYGDNPAVAKDKHHYLFASPDHNKYNDASQRHTAEQIVADYKASHYTPRHSADAQAAEPTAPTEAQTNSNAPVDLDKELMRILQEQRDAGLLPEAAPPTPARHETLLGYSLTDEQVQRVRVTAVAVGSAALIAGSVYTGRHRQELKERRLKQELYGTAHRHREYSDVPPTVPKRTNPANYFTSAAYYQKVAAARNAANTAEETTRHPAATAV